MRELISPFLIGIGQTAAVLVYLLHGNRDAFREKPVRGLYTIAFYLLLSLIQARLHAYLVVSGMGSLPTLQFLALSWLLYALFLVLWSRASWEICCFLAFVLLLGYNGKKGRGLKWLFYVFYPGHMLLLYFIGRLI